MLYATQTREVGAGAHSRAIFGDQHPLVVIRHGAHGRRTVNVDPFPSP
jgi:hypothetical protein